MNTNKAKSLIWVIASVTAGTALYVLLPTYWRFWWDMLQSWIQGGNPFKSFPFWVLPAAIILNLVLIFKLIASYGMFRLRAWGRTLTIYVLSADFLLRLAGFVNVLTYHSPRLPEMIYRYKELKSMPPGHVIVKVSLIPGYIIGLLSLISVIILIIRPVKETFRGIATEADKSESP